MLLFTLLILLCCIYYKVFYQSPLTLLFIMFCQTSYMAVCFNHLVVVFRPLKYIKVKLQF